MPSPTPTTLAPTVREFRISTRCEIGSQPSVFGDYVVWAEYQSPDMNIHAYHIPSKQETTIATMQQRYAWPHVAGDLAVWQGRESFYGYPLGTGDAEEFFITSHDSMPVTMSFGRHGYLAYERLFFALSDRALAWSDSETKETCDILAFDLERDARVRITDDTVAQTWPAAASSLVVWMDERNDGGDIYAYDLDTQEEFPVVTAPFTQTMPSTDGRHVVWIDKRDGNDDIYGYDVETQAEFPVVTGSAERILPAVWGNFVIWMENRYDDWHVYGYDLLVGEEFPIVTGTICAGGGPRIWGNIVVWTDYRDEEYAIYGAALEY
jgi:beta propeller repeat protein